MLHGTGTLQSPITEGRRVTAAKLEQRYQVIIPIGPVTTVSYFTPRNRDDQQANTKKGSFDGILKKQMRMLELEEDQTFQAYC